MRTARKLPTHFAAHALHARNIHIIVGRGLMPHPGDGRRLGTINERDAFRPRHSATADRGCVVGNTGGQFFGKGRMAMMETEKIEHGFTEIPGIVLLLSRAPLTGGFEFALIRRIRAFRLKFQPQRFNTRRRRPDAVGKYLAPFVFQNGPAGTVLLDSPTEGRITGRKQSPVIGHSQDAPVQTEDAAVFCKGSNFNGAVSHATRV